MEIKIIVQNYTEEQLIAYINELTLVAVDFEANQARQKNLCSLLSFAASKGYIDCSTKLLSLISDVELYNYLSREDFNNLPMLLAIKNKQYAWVDHFIHNNQTFLNFEQECILNRSALVPASRTLDGFPTLIKMLKLGNLKNRTLEVAGKVIVGKERDYAWLDALLEIEEFKEVAQENNYLYCQADAIRSGDFDRIEHLHKTGKLLNYDIYEDLKIALSNGHEKAVQYLLGKYVLPSQIATSLVTKDILQKQIAASFVTKDILQLKIPILLEAAATYGKLATMRKLMSDIYVSNHLKNNSELCIQLVKEAARNNHLDIIEFLFENTQIFLNAGKDLLNYAIENKKAEVAYEVARLMARQNDKILNNLELKELLKSATESRLYLKAVVKRFKFIPDRALFNISCFVGYMHPNARESKQFPLHDSASVLNRLFNTDKRSQLHWMYKLVMQQANVEFETEAGQPDNNQALINAPSLRS